MQEGEPQPKLRPAREDDKFIVSRDVVVVLPEFEHDDEVFGPLECRMLWSVKAKEVHVELTEKPVPRYLVVSCLFGSSGWFQWPGMSSFCTAAEVHLQLAGLATFGTYICICGCIWSLQVCVAAFGT